MTHQNSNDHLNNQSPLDAFLKQNAPQPPHEPFMQKERIQRTIVEDLNQTVSKNRTPSRFFFKLSLAIPLVFLAVMISLFLLNQNKDQTAQQVWQDDVGESLTWAFEDEFNGDETVGAEFFLLANSIR